MDFGMKLSVLSPASLRRAFLLFQFARKMGFRYLCFRVWYGFQKKTGLLKLRFPVHSEVRTFVSLEQWRVMPLLFFFDSQRAGGFQSKELSSLKYKMDVYRSKKLCYFNSVSLAVVDWHTNPETGFRYDATKHWTRIPTMSREQGDIKYTWERSRFSFLYDLIRYDFHYREDQSEAVFSEILSWIHGNPVNLGPNWVCSQEISLRVLNWTFALHFYKTSPNLTSARFEIIINSIYRQMQHVAENIGFSRIAVRNNHTLTETLALYTTGLMYPFFAESAFWKTNGKQWFEEEIAWQIGEDGTFLQHSMNYHRVVIQLLTWAIRLTELHGDRLSNAVYHRAERSLRFLLSCQDNKSGWLPNHGNNDGALFFPLTNCHFRDFRPQLFALSVLLGQQSDYGIGDWEEEIFWFGGTAQSGGTGSEPERPVNSTRFVSFDRGYCILRDGETLTFLRCASYKHRPFQADNLHLDIWVNGENILRDAGTYKYNTDEKWRLYFAGTASHNTLMAGDADQMEKGPSFIWFNWNTKSSFSCREDSIGFILEGQFEGFRKLGKRIVHRRKITKKPGKLRWMVEDRIENLPESMLIHQIWHPGSTFFEKFSIKAFDAYQREIPMIHSEGWYSESYGQKEQAQRILFSTTERYIKTIIQSQSCQTDDL
jgi:hypothetical protein